MFRHVVMLKFVDSATEEQINDVIVNLRTLPSRIPVIKSYTVERDAGLDPSRNSHVVILAEFNSKDDYLVYSTDSNHIDVIEKYIKPIIAQGGRSSVQFPVNQTKL
eukprot:c33519_g1_i1.p1 GENE.c33519_g1_i1~~c33519_g1_i1.p1  ORF type:complete len:120 (+),score=42.61 c33519_g1_i1:43-360(+)